MHKTGSSALQAALSELKIPGIYYPATRSRDHNGLLASAFRENPSLHLLRRGLDPSQIEIHRSRARDTLSRILAKAPSEAAVILSAEVLYSFTESELVALKAFLSAFERDVKAVAFIRAPASYMASSFQEQLKRGRLRLDLSYLYPRYQARIGCFDAVFGVDRVMLIPFEPHRPEVVSIVDRLLERLGISHRVGPIPKQNQGLSRDAVSLLYAMRVFGTSFGSGPEAMLSNDRLLALLGTLSGPALNFSEALLSPVLSAQREDMEWLHQRLGLELTDQAPDPLTSVKSEGDLLDFSPNAYAWLAQQCEKYELKPPENNSPSSIAAAMEAIRNTSGTSAH
jgi:hypothetical protein